MPRPVIGIDVDGVIADLNTPMKDEYERVTGKKMLTTNWHPVNEDGSKIRWEELEAVFRMPGLWRNLAVYEGSHAALQILDGVGDVFLHTCPPKDAPLFFVERMEWVKHVLKLDLPIVFTTDKGLLKADYFVDDRLRFVRHFGEVNPLAKCYLVRRPWSFEDGIDYMRYRVKCAAVTWVNSLYEAAAYIQYQTGGDARSLLKALGYTPALPPEEWDKRHLT